MYLKNSNRPWNGQTGTNQSRESGTLGKLQADVVGALHGLIEIIGQGAIPSSGWDDMHGWLEVLPLPTEEFALAANRLHNARSYTAAGELGAAHFEPGTCPYTGPRGASIRSTLAAALRPTSESARTRTPCSRPIPQRPVRRVPDRQVLNVPREPAELVRHFVQDLLHDLEPLFERCNGFGVGLKDFGVLPRDKRGIWQLLRLAPFGR